MKENNEGNEGNERNEDDSNENVSVEKEVAEKKTSNYQEKLQQLRKCIPAVQKIIDSMAPSSSSEAQKAAADKLKILYGMIHEPKKDKPLKYECLEKIEKILTTITKKVKARKSQTVFPSLDGSEPVAGPSGIHSGTSQASDLVDETNPNNCSNKSGKNKPNDSFSKRHISKRPDNIDSLFQPDLNVTVGKPEAPRFSSSSEPVNQGTRDQAYYIREVTYSGGHKIPYHNLVSHRNSQPESQRTKSNYLEGIDFGAPFYESNARLNPQYGESRSYSENARRFSDPYSEIEERPRSSFSDGKERSKTFSQEDKEKHKAHSYESKDTFRPAYHEESQRYKEKHGEKHKPPKKSHSQETTRPDSSKLQERTYTSTYETYDRRITFEQRIVEIETVSADSSSLPERTSKNNKKTERHREHETSEPYWSKKIEKDKHKKDKKSDRHVENEASELYKTRTHENSVASPSWKKQGKGSLGSSNLLDKEEQKDLEKLTQSTQQLKSNFINRLKYMNAQQRFRATNKEATVTSKDTSAHILQEEKIRRESLEIPQERFVKRTEVDSGEIKDDANEFIDNIMSNLNKRFGGKREPIIAANEQNEKNTNHTENKNVHEFNNSAKKEAETDSNQTNVYVIKKPSVSAEDCAEIKQLVKKALSERAKSMNFESTINLQRDKEIAPPIIEPAKCLSPTLDLEKQKAIVKPGRNLETPVVPVLDHLSAENSKTMRQSSTLVPNPDVIHQSNLLIPGLDGIIPSILEKTTDPLNESHLKKAKDDSTVTKANKGLNHAASQENCAKSIYYGNEISQVDSIKLKFNVNDRLKK